MSTTTPYVPGPAPEPVAPDLSRGHELHLAEWRVVDGGVVVMRWQAFCHCYWSQRWPAEHREAAVKAHADHVAEVSG